MSSPGFKEYQTCKKKKRFATEEECRKALRQASRKWNKIPHQRQPKRYYPCPYCHGWHLTSKESRF